MKYFIKMLFLLVSHILYAQLDNVHYLQPIVFGAYGTTQSNVKNEAVYISTPTKEKVTIQATFMDGVTPVGVKITNNDNSILYKHDGIFELSNSNPVRIEFIDNNNAVLSPGKSPISIPLDRATQILQSNEAGVKFVSDHKVYLNYRATATGHSAGVLTKGTYALGKEFHWGGSKYEYKGTVADHSAMLSLTALEDNTIVKLSGLDIGIEFSKGSNGIRKNTTSEISDTLQSGESIVYQVKLAGYTNATQNALQRLGWFGKKISSNKNIIATIGGLSAQGSSGTNGDYALEQLVSTDKLGKNHIIMKGNGGTSVEKVFVIATEPNTTIKVNGQTYGSELNVNDNLLVPSSQFKNGNMYIESSKNVYVFHKIHGGSAGNTGNYSQVPPLKCDGQSFVDLMPDVSRIVSITFTNTTLFIASQTVPKVYRNGTLLATPTGYAVTGLSNWKTYKYSIGGNKSIPYNIKVEAESSIQAQILGANGNAGFGSYYAGFLSSSPLPISLENLRFNLVCTGDTGKSVIRSLIQDDTYNYHWYKNGILMDDINGFEYEIPDVDVEPSDYKLIIETPDGCNYTSEIIKTVKCPCTKQPNPNPGIVYPGIVGISTTDNTDKSWPNNVNNAFLTLKSNDKGLVITRNANPETTIAEPVEGMIVYDTDDNCFKLYDGKIWKCLRKKCYDYDN